ncbi:MAG: SpoIIE family protein phosphatase [Candidatus Omnitrophica bacterium]|nr:SpoIIE family protein phosphatase [Candidatus Omnitrophota bacterium]MCM8798120.1 SpoIIE family protein phosphatase [Candidatus Omnitrophota bacterium]
MKRWQKVYLSFFSLGFLFLIFSSLWGLCACWERKWFDWFLRFKPRGKIPSEIILVEIDEALKAEGLWPWKREWLVYLINYLSALGTKAIWVDSSLKNYLFEEHPLLKSAQARTSLFYPRGDSLETVGEDLFFDRDGKIRRYRLYRDSLIRQIYFVYKGEEKNLPEEFLIHYHKWGYGEIEKYSYFDLVLSIFLLSRQENPRIDFSRFKDKICVIALAPEIENKFYPTPFYLASPLEIRLQVLSNLLREDFLYPLKRGENTAILLWISLLSLWVFTKLKWPKRIIFWFFLGIAYLTISFALFFFLRIYMDNFLPLSGISYVFLAVSLYYHSQERVLRIEEKRKELARRLKNETLVNHSLFTEDLELLIKSSSSDKVEGDFFDIVKFDDHRLGVLLGKAAGNNLEAVNYIIKLVNEFRLHAPLHKRPRVVLNEINNILFSESTKGMYATAIYLILDTEKQILSITNAGHEPLLLINEDNQEVTIYEAMDSTPLGIARNVNFPDAELSLKKIDLVVGFTSGVVEVKNREGREFGIHNLKEVILQYRTWNINKLMNKIFEKIHRFSQGQKISQECSLLLIKIKEKPLKKEEVVYEERKTSLEEIAQ